MNQPIGREPRTLKLSVDKTGLFFDVDLPPTSYGISLAEVVKRRIVRGGSITMAPTEIIRRREGDREIAKLKRQLREEEKKIAFLEAQERKRLEQSGAADNDNATDGARFSARSVKAQRKRTGFSAADYAKLVGVSALTVYNWESGKSRPRKEQLASLVALRGIGKREAQAKLDLLIADEEKEASKTRRARRKK